MTEKSKFHVALCPHLHRILLICFIAVFVFSVSMLMLDYAQGAREENALKELASKVAGGQEPDLLAQYQALSRQNPGMAGWIRIDGTSINYPVMHTPNDGDFYLDHGFDKEAAKSGVPFIDARCAVNPLGTNTIIYGHNMKNGTMFADLEKYSDEAFYAAHPTIHFDTLYAQHEYEIIAVFESQVPRKKDMVFKYYDYVNVDDAEVFNEYIRSIQALSLYDTGTKVSCGDMLITLVTCAYYTENGRFVVVARKKW